MKEVFIYSFQYSTGDIVAKQEIVATVSVVRFLPKKAENIKCVNIITSAMYGY